MIKKHRIAVIEGGTYFHYFSFVDPEVSDLIDKVLYLPELSTQDLADVDTLVLMSRLNPDLLQEKKEIILSFKANGGKLVVLAENKVQNWLPAISFRDTEVNFWWWLEAGADSGIRVIAPQHELFNFIDERAVIWHYHGVFALPQGATEIVRGREGGAILYEDTDGTLLSTLDPDFHHGNFFMPGATLFWYGLLNYLAYRL